MNYSTYYLLPLTRNKMQDFQHLVNCYLTPDHSQLVLKMTRFSYRFIAAPFYRRHWNEFPYFYLELYIPTLFLSDVNKFLEGKYSQMSPEARGMILNSGNYVIHDAPVSKLMLEHLQRKVNDSLIPTCHVCFCEGANYRIISPVLTSVYDLYHPAREAHRVALREKYGINIGEMDELNSRPTLENEIFAGPGYSGDCRELDRSEYE